MPAHSARRSLRLRVAPVALAALLAWPAAALAAPWRTDVVPSDHAVTLRDLAFAPDGTGLLTWERVEPERTDLARRAPATPWSAAAVTPLPGIAWGNAQVRQYGATRTILFAQERSGTGRFDRAIFRLVTALGRTDGTFAPARTLADRVAAPVADANRRGEAIVAWTPADGPGVFVAERAAGGQVGRPRALSRTTAVTAAVAVGADGLRVVAWGANGALYARARRPGNPWGPVQRVARVQLAPNGALHAHVTSGDKLVLTWETADVRESRPTTLAAGAAVRGPTTAWQATTLERSSGDVPGVEGARALAVTDTRGATWVAWTGIDAGATVVRAARLDWATPRDRTTLSAGASGAVLDDLATGRHGALAATWTARARPAFVTAAVTAIDGRWSVPDVLTPEGDAAIFGSRVAYDPATGEPVVAAGTITPDRVQRVLVFTGPAA